MSHIKTRRTTSEIRAEKIARLAERQKRDADQLAVLKREEARAARAAQTSARQDLGAWLGEQFAVTDVEDADLLKAAFDDKVLTYLRNAIAPATAPVTAPADGTEDEPAYA